MRVVGITGRSGCGKSSATNFLREQGYPCIDADLVAREVLLPDSACIPQLQAAFGTDIADENGEVRRRLLADRAFATPEGTAALTAITQPEILRRIDAALADAERAGAKIAFVDGAVIVGTPFEQRCDALILVTASYDTSVARICARDGIAPEMARRRLDAQLPLERLRGTIRRILFNQRKGEIIRAHEEELCARAAEMGEVKIFADDKPKKDE